MFRPMRRFMQQLPDSEAIEILENATSGVLAVLGDDDYPYAVPTGYVYHDNKLYFHCAVAGHKLDAMNSHPKASFCVVAKDEVKPAAFTTLFRSVIAFGKTRVLTDAKEKRAAIEHICSKYSAEYKDARLKEIEKEFSRLALIELTIEHITGKESIELTRERKK